MAKPIPDKKLAKLLKPLLEELKESASPQNRANKIGYFIFTLMTRSGLSDSQVYGQLMKVIMMVTKSTK